MRKESLGYRVQMTGMISKWIEKLIKIGGKSSYPILINNSSFGHKVDWDMVSLESSEKDDVSSIFPLLNRDVSQKMAIESNENTSERIIVHNFITSNNDISTNISSASETPDVGLGSPFVKTPTTHPAKSKGSKFKNGRSCSKGHDEMFVTPIPESPATTSSAVTSNSPIIDTYSVRSDSDDSPCTSDSSILCDQENLSRPNDICELFSDETILRELQNRESNDVKNNFQESDIEVMEHHSSKEILRSIIVDNDSTSLGIALKDEGAPQDLEIVSRKRKRKEILHTDARPPRPSRTKSTSFYEREAIFGSWVTRKQCAANGSWGI